VRPRRHGRRRGHEARPPVGADPAGAVQRQRPGLLPWKRNSPGSVPIRSYADYLRGWIGLAATLAPAVWVAGHSEGGLVGLVAARHAPPALRGLNLLAAPGRPLGDVLIGPIEANPANGPIMAEVRAIVADLQAGRRRTPDGKFLDHTQVQMPIRHSQLLVEVGCNPF
jgi:pimeloyl-ACP methyl ester carboxylesterase